MKAENWFQLRIVGVTAIREPGFGRASSIEIGAPQGLRNSRAGSLGDIVANVLPGRSRTEIEAQLGPSLDTSYFRSTGRDLIYITGPERNPLGLDSEWLLIWLNDSGMFERYDIVQD